MPALPLDDAGPYVAAAYLVFLALILIYVAIMASKLARIARDLGEVTELLDRRGHRGEGEREGAPGRGEGVEAGSVPR
jgi:hypothetical protein